MSKRTDYLNGDNSGTDWLFDELTRTKARNKQAHARIEELRLGVDDALRSFEMTGNSTHLTDRLHAVLTGEKLDEHK